MADWRHLIVLLGMLGLLSLSAWPTAVTEGLTFLDCTDQSVSFDQLVKRSPTGIVWLTFWCSRCGSCREAEPLVADAYQKWGEQVSIVAIDASAFDDADSIRSYQTFHRLQFPVYRDLVGGLADRFRIRTTTTTLIFQKDGQLRYFGDLPHASQALGELLSGGPVTQPTTPLRGCPIIRHPNPGQRL